MTGASLTESSLLVRNTLFNLAGYGLPAIVAIFALPVIVEALGTDRFGLLAIAWVLIGYLSLLDLGMGRALTKLVAEKIGEGALEQIPSLIWTALYAMTGVSIIMAVVFAFLSRWIANDILNIPMVLRSEAETSFLMLALVLPIVVISVGLKGILEAYQRFDLVNAVRIPMGVFTFAAPLVVIPFSVRLPAIITMLLIGRILSTTVQFTLCCRVVSGITSSLTFRRDIFKRLFRFGGWMTISNMISPVMVHIDRFFIGAILSVAAVAYYATPAEIMNNLVIVAVALTSVMFPAFSSLYHVDRARCAFLFNRGIGFIFIIMFPVVLLIVSFSFEVLSLWINSDFAGNSYRVCQILAVGAFFSCLANVPYALIQGAGRPDWTGKLHLIQLPIYIAMIATAIHWFGIVGAAVVWMCRSFVDLLAMYAMSRRLLSENRAPAMPKFMWFSAAVGFIVLIELISPLILRTISATLVLIAFAVSVHSYLMTKDDLVFLKHFFIRRSHNN